MSVDVQAVTAAFVARKRSRAGQSPTKKRNAASGVSVRPAAGHRPTTGWTAGEYIVDAHTLRLPDDVSEGDYRVLIGLYDETSLARLNTLDGKDAAPLSQITRVESRRP